MLLRAKASTRSMPIVALDSPPLNRQGFVGLSALIGGGTGVQHRGHTMIENVVLILLGAVFSIGLGAGYGLGTFVATNRR